MKVWAAFLRKQPFLIYWIFAACLILLGIIFQFLPITTFDINIKDTYFVVEVSLLAYIALVWFALCGLGLYLLQRYSYQPIFSLTLLHLSITILAFVPLCFAEWFTFFYNSYPEPNTPLYRLFEYEVKFTALKILAGAQLLYFISILISILKSKRS